MNAQPGPDARNIALGMMLMSEAKARAQADAVRQATSALRRTATNLSQAVQQGNEPFIADLRLMGALP